MTNREKYAEQIIDMAINNITIAVDEKGRPCDCNGIRCADCMLNDRPCKEMLKEWSGQEYVEPPVDWSKVPVDTKVYVRDSENGFWIPRHFARFEDGKIVTWNDGVTSFSTNGIDNVSKWKQGKLAEDTV